jgi:hypothetical protein
MRPQFRFVSKFGFGRLGFGRFRFSQGLDDLVSFRFVSIYLKAFLLSFVSFHDIKTHKFLCPGFGSKKKTVSIPTLFPEIPKILIGQKMFGSFFFAKMHRFEEIIGMA